MWGLVLSVPRYVAHFAYRYVIYSSSDKTHGDEAVSTVTRREVNLHRVILLPRATQEVRDHIHANSALEPLDTAQVHGFSAITHAMGDGVSSDDDEA